MMTRPEELTATLTEHAPRYGLRLDEAALAGLRDYYEHLSKWNERLHLVAPCSPSGFATRHVLESLTACQYMREGVSVCDVGSGGGLPIIPCLVVRADLRATLIEASTKKAVFLREALSCLGLQQRARVVAERFERNASPGCE